MSLNKLKDALQDYQNSYSECFGITPTSSVPTQGRAETNSALPQPDFKFEIPDPLEINSTQFIQEKVSSAQTDIDEDIPHPKLNPFAHYGQDNGPRHGNPPIQVVQPKSRTSKRKNKASTLLRFSYCLYSLCCVVSVMQFMIFTHPRGP